jgi:hypothetical protein
MALVVHPHPRVEALVEALADLDWQITEDSAGLDTLNPDESNIADREGFEGQGQLDEQAHHDRQHGFHKKAHEAPG